MDPATSFTVVLPWSPSANAMYRSSRGGGIYMQGKVRNWYEAAKLVIRATHGYKKHLFPEGTRVRVTHALVPPTNHKFDLDNRDKAIYDSLQKSGLIHNDVQVYAGPRMKFDKQPGGRYAGIYIMVEELPADFGLVFNMADAFGPLEGAT